MFATTKITSKGQITVPKAIRERLGVKPGDTLIYDIAGDTVTLKRLDPFDAAYHVALADTLDEWASAEDDKAFADL
ncbi:MAG: AbrB/MazE/SpoVT family DNA-binding domain-containing protein [Gemmatimonadaceae bacterium]